MHRCSRSPGTAAASAAEDDVASFTIHTENNSDLREPISKAVGARGWPIRRLDRKRGSLDDAFFDVLRAQDPLKGVPAGTTPLADAGVAAQET